MSNFRKKLLSNKSIFFIYKSLAKIKSMFLSLLSGIFPVFVSKSKYKSTFKRNLNLNNPTYFNEKLMWLKLNRYANDPLVIQCADKYKVREYVEECGLGETLNGLIGVWDDAKDIIWEDLPDKFAIKCNHGCGFNLICTDKSKLDIKKAVKTLNKWMKMNSWRNYAELHYKHIIPKIICEEFLEGKNGALPVDYKFYCFNGEPLYVGAYTDRDLESHSFNRGIFNLDWTPCDFSKYKDEMNLEDFTCPENFDKMIDYARVLSKAFPFVRVDFYNIDGRIVFGELTFTPTGCLANFYTEEAALKLGNAIDLIN